ncbi:hypothetical protein NDU88_004047, partial [Pleurodeles waltl]
KVSQWRYSRVISSLATRRSAVAMKGCPGGTEDVTEKEEAIGNPDFQVSPNIKNGQPTRRASEEEREKPEEDAWRRDGEAVQLDSVAPDSAEHGSPERPTNCHVPGGAWLRQ